MKTNKMLSMAATFLVLGGEKYAGGFISPLGVTGVMVSTLVHKTKKEQEVDDDGTMPKPVPTSTSESLQVNDCREFDETVTRGHYLASAFAFGFRGSFFGGIPKKARDCERAVDSQGNQCYVWTYPDYSFPGRFLFCRKEGDDAGMEPGAIKVPAWCWNVWTPFAQWHRACWSGNQ
ncbi:unnamed protein product [Amoebophrya sp. A120]|nr:unnamed protein product [Amoebophrya sp. A120]|eukprot:GSA120T00006967001.1